MVFKSCVRVVLDESMPAWGPKASKRGGLPNITFIVRKPVPLGTEFKNAADCGTGCITYLEVQGGKGAVHKKKYHKEMGPQGACVLRIAGGMGLQGGGVMYGDSWFGSVKAVWQAKKKQGIDMTCVVKTAHSLFPKARLTALLDGKPRGSCRVLTTTIDGIKAAAVGYKYNTSSTLYFVTTCGVTTAGGPHVAQWTTGAGDVHTTAAPRPDLCAQYYNNCTKIDDHNHYRQHYLHLERPWAAQDCWPRLLTSICAMCVAGLYLARKHVGKLLPGGTDDDERIKSFVQHLCKKMLVQKYYPKARMTSKRKAALIDPRGGLHVCTEYEKEHGGPTKRRPVNSKKPGQGTRVDKPRIWCKVCKANKTNNICLHCKGGGNSTGAVCSRGTREPCCWQRHLDEQFDGLANSGPPAPPNGGYPG